MESCSVVLQSKPRSLDCNLKALLVCVIISVCGYLQALAPARIVRVSALRAAPQGLWANSPLLPQAVEGS